MGKKLIINADDYGSCREVNDAIENLVTQGKVRSVSVLANSWHYENAARFLSSNPECSVGVHLNIVEGIPLSSRDTAAILCDAHGQFLDPRKLLTRWARSPFAVAKAVEIEWRLQIELLQNDGLTISHADSHQHIHAFPPFWGILARLCREHSIPAMRLPRESNKLRRRRFSSIALGRSAGVGKALYSNGHFVSNDHFLGFKRSGSYGESEMISDVSHLHEGVTELIVHPSLFDGVPYPNLHGEMEYRGLLGTTLWKHIEDLEIDLITWSDLGAHI